ncbi:MAG TPA: gamma-glutamyl-gamma-aminobutyrate hydrolase family protein, partial [Archangium sp.]
MTGGAFDIPPEAYGEKPKDGLGALKPGRTNFEMAMLKAALQRKLPVLGIC